MPEHGLILFSLVYLLAVATPGPGIAAIVARVLGRGMRGIVPFIAGFIVGDLTWLTLAATGMAALAQAAHWAFLAIKYVGVAYLLILAYRMWRAPVRALSEEVVTVDDERAARSFLAALTLTLGNPKVVVFFLALLPTVIDVQRLTPPLFLSIGLIIGATLSTVLGAYALLALRARRLFRNARAVQWLNRASGSLMAGAAAGIAAQ